MSLNLDKTTWRRVTLGSLARHVTDRVDAGTSGLERFLAGEHIPSNCLAITEWGVIGRDPIGPMFYKRFHSGHVLYVSRRTYLRKVAVPEFEGITGEKTFVLETIDDGVLLQDFLPLVLSAERFHAYAITNSRGSVNPYLNWGELAAYEFALPPVDDQRHICDLLWAVEGHRRTLSEMAEAARRLLMRIRSGHLEYEGVSLPAAEAFAITIGRQRSPRHREGDHIVPYLRSANVTAGGIDVTDVKQMNFEPTEQAKFALEVGDVLVSEASASSTAVGMPSVWEGQLPGVVCFQNTLLRFRAVDGHSLPGFVANWCQWAFETGRFLAVASGTNIRHIGVGGASDMRVHLPAIGDQELFVERIAAVGSAVNATEAELASLVTLQASLLAEVFGAE